MTKKALRIFLVLVLCAGLCLSMAAPAFAVSGNTDFTNGETYLRTSHNEDNFIELSISGNTLTVRGTLLLNGLNGILVECGSVQAHKYISSGASFTLRLALNHTGYKSVDIFTNTNSDTQYWSFNYDRIYIEKTAQGYRFMPSLFQENNTTYEQLEIDPGSLLSSDIPASVVAKSNEIVGSETDAYTKVFLLHKWVAENIYYDHDALYGYSARIDDSAGVLEARRAVCAGYSYLLRDLILAQGIPAMYCSNLSTYTSYALGTHTGEAHAHTEAYVDGRWITMDATWDSRNVYQNGVYTTDSPDGYCYFDITSELFAMDHRITSRGDIHSFTDPNGFRIRIWDGTLVGYEGEGGLVVVPSSVTSIEGWAFSNCANLTGVVLPSGITKIDTSTFRGCTGLPGIILPSSVTTIGMTAFEGCSSLRSIVIPNGVTTIEDGAFQHCTSLSSIILPSSITSIGRSAFFGCTALKSVTIPGSAKLNEYTFFDCEALERMTFCDGVTVIPDNFLYYCSNLSTVTIPASVTFIGDDAFLYCDKLTTVYGQPGSYAETWAKQNHLTFLPSGEYPELNGLTCSDWAQNEVITAIRAGIVPGDLPANYTGDITRAQFCRIATALYESMTGNTIEITAGFLDTDDIYVRKMASLGVVNGVGDNLFKPNDTLKRDQAATILARLAEAMGNELTAVNTPFTDVPNNWATDSIAKIYGIGVMQGTGSGTTFTPLGSYTIEQAILTTLRLMNYMNN